MLQPDLKIAALMKDLVRNFSKPVDLVLDAFLGRFNPQNCA